MQATLSNLDEILERIGPEAPLRVYLAGRDRAGQRLPDHVLTAIEREFAEIAGGCTVIPARGWWADTNRPPTPEAVRIIEVHFPQPLTVQQRNRFRQALGRILSTTNQRFLAITINNRMALIAGITDPGDDEQPVLVG